MAKRKRSVNVRNRVGPAEKRTCFHGVIFTKLVAAAGVLFLVTVWPAFLEVVLRVHWGWYLAAMVLFGLVGMKHFYGCCCKK